MKTLEKLKKSAVRDQIVAGRKFNGVSFKSQPRQIHFKVNISLNPVFSCYYFKILLTRILMLEIVIK